MLDNSVSTFEQTPNEIYQFNYSKEELDEIRRIQGFSYIRRPVIVIIVLFFLLIPNLISSPENHIIVFVSVIIMIMLFSIIVTVKNHNKVWTANIERIAESTYELDFYDNHVIIKTHRNGEKVRECKCYYKDFEWIYNSEKWLFLVISGQSYIIRKYDLKENSILYAYMHGNINKIKEIEPLNILNLISITLFFASLYSIFIALFAIGKLSSANGLFVENTWVFFTLTPLPLSSLIFGCFLKSKGQKYKLNFITGIIITAFLCIYGSFVFIF